MRRRFWGWRSPRHKSTNLDEATHVPNNVSRNVSRDGGDRSSIDELLAVRLGLVGRTPPQDGGSFDRSRLSNRPGTPIPGLETDRALAPRRTTRSQSNRSHPRSTMVATREDFSSSNKSEEEIEKKQGSDVICNICGNNGSETDIPFGKVTERCQSIRTICVTCLNRHIEERVGKHMFRTIPCICVQRGCTVDRLSFQDIQRHASADVFERYDTGLLRANLEADQEFCWCARPGCGSGQLHQSQHKYPIMRCHACRSRTCFSHKCEWHSGRTCEQYDRDAKASDEVALLQLLETSRFRRCPKCSHGVEKNDGCDHMTCRCRHEFCWLCLAPYQGPKGIFNVGNKAHKKSCRHYA